MVLTVKLYTRLREAAGVSEVTVDPTPKTVRELLEKLVSRFGERFEDLIYERETEGVRSSVAILVNGHSIKLLRGLDTPLKSGDIVVGETIDIIEVVGGG